MRLAPILIPFVAALALTACSSRGDSDDISTRFEEALPVPEGASLDNYHRHYAVMDRDEASEYVGYKLPTGHFYLIGLFLFDDETGRTSHSDWLGMPRADSACHHIIALDEGGDFLTEPKWNCGIEAPRATPGK